MTARITQSLDLILLLVLSSGNKEGVGSEFPLVTTSCPSAGSEPHRFDLSYPIYFLGKLPEVLPVLPCEGISLDSTRIIESRHYSNLVNNPSDISVYIDTNQLISARNIFLDPNQNMKEEYTNAFPVFVCNNTEQRKDFVTWSVTLEFKDSKNTWQDATNKSFFYCGNFMHFRFEAQETIVTRIQTYKQGKEYDVRLSVANGSQTFYSNVVQIKGIIDESAY